MRVIFSAMNVIDMSARENEKTGDAYIDSMEKIQSRKQTFQKFDACTTPVTGNLDLWKAINGERLRSPNQLTSEQVVGTDQWALDGLSSYFLAQRQVQFLRMPEYRQAASRMSRLV